MKFLYEYRTSDNAKHAGVISASSREAAFAALRAQGIRPSVVTEAPGLFNKLFGKGKRWIAIVALLFVVAVLSYVLIRTKSEAVVVAGAVSYTRADGSVVPIERRQIWGDEAVIELASSKNWRVIFENPANRLLSLFAQPGYMVPVFPRIPESIHDDFDRALKEKMVVAPNDLDEYKQMRCIVAGMKDELRAYLAAGGTLDGYLKRLIARQREESDFVNRAKADLDRRIEKGEDALSVWQETNKVLREQGLKSVPMPSSF